MNKKKQFFTAMMLFVCLTLTAQSNLLSDKDKEEIRLRAKYKIEDFQKHLSTIASRNVSRENKKATITTALNLFIGKGDAYTYYENGEKKFHDPVQMQISKKKYGKVETINKPMKNYLTALSNLTNYTKVVIESGDAVFVSNISETADGRYEAIATFCQKFYGYRDGRLIYNDETTKKMRIYIEKEVLPVGPNKTEIVWHILLGDTYVVETH